MNWLINHIIVYSFQIVLYILGLEKLCFTDKHNFTTVFKTVFFYHSVLFILISFCTIMQHYPYSQDTEQQQSTTAHF